MTWEILTGDCRDVLRTLPERSVQTCVTSPPYFGLRDYGHDGQIGLEPTPSCGRQGMFRLRSDLTEDQRRYVVQRLLGEEPRDV
jgi:DNA modification methylase